MRKSWRVSMEVVSSNGFPSSVLRKTVCMWMALEGMTKPIGVADNKLIIPKEEQQKTIAAEIQLFEEEHAEDKIEVKYRYII